MHGIRTFLPLLPRLSTKRQFESLTVTLCCSAVGKDCMHLELDVYVCIGIPGLSSKPASSSSSPTPKPTPINGPQPQQPGTVSYCKKYYKVQPGQGCWDIQQSQHVSLADWAKWNPGVNTECGNLQPNVHVCVGV
jgi:hypothetical protein